MIPTNEHGVVSLFSEYAAEMGYTFKRIGASCPDAIMEKDGQEVRVEFEFTALNFKRHKHNPEDVDLIICWNDDWPESPVPVLSLQMYLTLYRGKAPKELAWVRLLNWLRDAQISRIKNNASVRRICPNCGAIRIPKYIIGMFEDISPAWDGKRWYNGKLTWTCPECHYLEERPCDYGSLYEKDFDDED